MTRPILIDLTNRPGMQIVIDESDYHLVEGRSVYLSSAGYACISTNKTGPLLVHRLICPASPGEHVDHIDGDRLNNTRANLRAVSPQVNQLNRHRLNRNNASGVRGVSRTSASTKNPWRAQITVNRQNIYLGLFPTQEAAVAARLEAERRFYPEECPR